jgi:hypothetical protein
MQTPLAYNRDYGLNANSLNCVIISHPFRTMRTGRKYRSPFSRHAVLLLASKQIAQIRMTPLFCLASALKILK